MKASNAVFVPAKHLNYHPKRLSRILLWHDSDMGIKTHTQEHM